MKHYVALGLVLGAMLLSTPAWATNPRTFVSVDFGFGIDGQISCTHSRDAAPRAASSR